MSRSSTRQSRRARPGLEGLEGLEGRQLLSTSVTPAATGSGSSSSSGTASTTPPTGRELDHKMHIHRKDVQLSYTTPQGTKVRITVFGVGSLAGSTVDPGTGALHLIYSETNESTAIVGQVSGGTGEAPLASIRHASEGQINFSGVNSTVLNIVNLKNFDLINGGQINLTGGVHQLYLNSVGANAQIHLRELPEQFQTSSSNPSSSSASDNGVNLQFALDVASARTLTSVSGQPLIPNFPVAANTQVTSATSGHNPGPPPAPPGVVVSLGSVHGGVPASNALADPEVFGYDPVANTLIRFDATTGAQLQTISLAGLGTMTTGAALGRDNQQLVALVGNGSTIYAFNALNGTPVGQFTTANLSGFTSVDGIGSTDNRTVIASSGVPGGIAQTIDVTASLATGQAVPTTSSFTPQREFAFTGGLTGVAGQNTVYETGAGFFDTAQPNLTQQGIMAISVGNTRLSESSRTALKSNGNFINAGPLGMAQTMPFMALGSIDQNLALVTGVSNGKNNVSLLNPSSLASQGTITLNDPNQLAGLSESFRPGLAGTTLLDVQGNVQSLRATNVQGLVFNTDGYANLIKMTSVSDSAFEADPIAHLQIVHRSNLTVISSPRSVGHRNGVMTRANLQPIGPLSLPTPQPQPPT
jgi:hypothetical protein